MYHIFFIHPAVNGYFPCFHLLLLSIVHEIWGGCVFSHYTFSPNTGLGVGLAYHVVALFLVSFFFF